MRILYMGTPDFAVGALKALYDAGHEICGVFTQPDRPKGRGGKVLFPPVKEMAVELGLDVYQPVKIKDEEYVNIIKELAPDLAVVAAFGQILSKEILDIPKYGCVNIHASLLPKHRGASPIQQAVIDGDSESGITIMMMDEGLDTGDILIQKKVSIDEKETGGSLFDKLAECGSSLILEAVEMLASGDYELTPQGDDFSYAGIIDKKRGCIDFSMEAVQIERLIRGLNPWPSAYTKLNGKTLKIWEADVCDEETCEPYGMITDISQNGIIVSTGNKKLILREVQPEGKKRMSVKDYLNGARIEVGTMLG